MEVQYPKNHIEPHPHYQPTNVYWMPTLWQILYWAGDTEKKKKKKPHIIPTHKGTGLEDEIDSEKFHQV